MWSLLNSRNVSLSMKLKPFHFESLQYDFFNHLKMKAVPILAFSVTKILPTAQWVLP